ncbi:hypothetical protein [Mucilaginibacter sp. PAMB04168]|uniref:hypothetical protein n=1 Tax=Mucilaginibacter sp. PAMB04168 TaxID=3138567 RepID=UPI0031F6DF31
MNLSKPALFFFVLLLTVFKVSAQSTSTVVEYFVNGENGLIRKGTYEDVDGTPFMYNKFLPGKAVTTTGKVYDNIKLNYNLYDDMLLFVYDTSDKAMKFEEQIKSFTIYTPLSPMFANGYPAIDKQTAGSYYEVLSSNGKVALLKHQGKLLNKVKNYDATETRKFQDYTNYYVYKNNKLEKFEKSKSAVLTALADKKTELDVYLKTAGLNFKKDEDLAKIFDYYNTL